jgi:epidermal growth factor receptor substrate 15
MRLIFLCLIGFLFSVNVGFSQVMIPVQITTKNALTDTKEGGIVLKVYDGTTIVKTISSDANGLIKFTIPGGKKYRVEFSKAGKVGRFMLWDFKNVVDEVISGNVIPMMESPLSLFEEVPGVDFSFFKTNPVTEFYYDPAIDKEKMANDVVKSQKTIKKQESIKKEIENLKGQSNAQYNALIKEAQGLEKQEKYTEAIAKYEKASALDKNATLPGERIAELELLVNAQKGNNATNAQLDQDYKNLVNSANTLRDQGKTEEALDKYEAAYKIKKEQYVLDEIDKCELALKAEKSQGANKVKYDQAIKQGDVLVTQKSWEAAKAKYNEALQAIPNDPIAKTKLTDVSNKLTQQLKEQQLKEQQLKEQQLKEQQLKEQQLKEQQLKEQQLKEQQLKEQQLKEQQLKEQQLKEQQLKEQQLKEQQLKEQQLKEQQLKEQQLKEQQLKEQQLKEQQLKEQQLKEQQLKEQQLKEQQLKEQQLKEQQLKEQQLKEQQLKEQQLKEQQLKEQQLKEQQLKEQQLKEQQLKEQQLKEQQLKEQQLKEQQLKEQQLKEQQLKEQQLKEQQLKEQQLKEQQLKEQQLKEQQLKEQQLKEQQLKEQQLKEQQLKEQQLKEQQLKEQQLKEQQLKEQQLKEQQLKEQQLKEQQLKEQQLKEQQLKEQQLKEQQLKEQQLKEQQLKEQQLKEQQLKEQQLKEQQLKEQQLKEQQLKEQQQQLEAKNYEKLIADAQTALDNRDYEKAAELFKSAVVKRPEDTYAVEKLANSKDLLEKENQKKATLSSYTNKIQQAENAVTAKKYDEAIALFTAAKQLNSNQDVTDKRILDVKALQEKEATNNANANLLLEQQRDFVNKAKLAESNKQFDLALSHYEAADKINPGDKIISGKINEMKQLLDNQAVEKQQQLAKQEVITSLLKKADLLYKASNWNEAKLIYEEVLQQDPSNGIAIKRQKDCLDNLAKKTAQEEEEVYQSIVSKANENFKKKDYKNAKKLYERASKIRPTDKFVKAQLLQLNNLNKPKPPVTIPQPPVEVPVKKEPEPLADLGVKSEISLQDAQAKLEAADKARKNKKSTNLTEELKGVQTNDGDLQLNQQATISTTKSAINEIVLAADISEDTSDVSRHLNRALVDSIYGYQQGVTTNNQLVERSELYFQKEQIDLATNTVSDQNSILDGKGIENEQIIRKERVERENINTQNNETEVNQNEHTTQEFMTIRLKNEQKEVDESVEKAVFTAQISELKKADENASIATQDKQQQATYAVKDVLNTATKVVTTKEQEDSKLPGLNSDLLTKTEKSSQDHQDADQLNRQNYLQGIKGDLNKEAGVITKYDESMTEKRLDNATTLAIEKKELTDKNDVDQTESHDKSISNKTTINNAKVAIIPDTLSAAATVRLVNDLVSKEQNGATTAQASQTEKQQGNKKTIDGSVNAQEKTAAGLNDAGNIEQLKTVAKDLENNAGVQQTAAQDKRIASRKVLDALYKKETKFTDKLANDLGAIYPEGVSQDQFEILGHDGLVSGIATRRIVVKNGRGAVYVRTQSMTAITYSKNGQACTELVWQRETQDALLKRNY